ncbi:RHS repeat-associated core domain-containing protein [Pseudomonas sp. NPDC087336]|jgi:RHS repeat-associated protein|uniref:RHS repeat-associated core domain-containing protein n=1 Tax=Pseudomonas sp. NPDC087336 TaxID=3364436 RepID=UPI003809D642
MSSQSHKRILLATDQQQSVLNALDANQPNPIAYTPYGHRPRENRLLSLLGFNGELPDPLTGHYHLGKGYRQFNPVLMRFNSPDSWSPFGKGGLNAYMYCAGDPVNRADPTGHMLKSFFKARRTPSPSRNATAVPTDASSSRSSTEALQNKNKNKILVDILKGDKGKRILVYQLANGDERIAFSEKTKATETMLKLWKKDPSLKPTRKPVPTSNVRHEVVSGTLDIDTSAPALPGSDRALKNENALNQLIEDIRGVSE